MSYMNLLQLEKRNDYELDLRNIFDKYTPSDKEWDAMISDFEIIFELDDAITKEKAAILLQKKLKLKKIDTCADENVETSMDRAVKNHNARVNDEPIEGKLKHYCFDSHHGTVVYDELNTDGQSEEVLVFISKKSFLKKPPMILTNSSKIRFNTIPNPRCENGLMACDLTFVDAPSNNTSFLNQNHYGKVVSWNWKAYTGKIIFGNGNMSWRIWFHGNYSKEKLKVGDKVRFNIVVNTNKQKFLMATHIEKLKQ